MVVPALELKRLAEAEAMVARFSRENEWLAMQVLGFAQADAAKIH